MTDAFWNRRRDAYAELERGLDRKLTMGRPYEALDHLKQAHLLATHPQPLPWPLPQITAFRLAHFLMRSASTVEDLQEVDQLLAEATSHGRWIGPWPVCVHLAALSRIRGLGGDADDRIQSLLQRLHSYLQAEETDASPSHRGAEERQSLTLNLAELVTYFLGAEYAPLEGYGALGPAEPDPFRGLIHDPPWKLVGTEFSGGPRRLPRRVAVGELEELVSAGRLRLGVVFDGKEGEIILANGHRKRLKAHQGRLLASLCRPRTKTQLDDALGTDAAQPLSRMKKDLAQLLDCQPDDVAMFDQLSERYKLSPDLRLLVAHPAR